MLFLLLSTQALLEAEEVLDGRGQRLVCQQVTY